MFRGLTSRQAWLFRMLYICGLLAWRRIDLVNLVLWNETDALKAGGLQVLYFMVPKIR